MTDQAAVTQGPVLSWSAWLATMVHSLDVADGAYSPEAAGFEAVLTGARETYANDDDLIAAVFPVIDMLYAGFVRERNQAVPADA